MKKPVNSIFFQRPGTKIGWWAGGLAALSILMLTINNLGLNPLDKLVNTTLIPVKIYDFVMMGSLGAGIVLGIIALTTKRERSWIVWLFMIPVLFTMTFLIVALIQRFTYDTRVEIVPTPDANIERMAVIFDDDGSPDGTSALLYLLSEPRVELIAVSVSYGEAHPQVYIQHLGELLARFGYGDLPLGAGQDAPLTGSNAFPDFVREASNSFWGFAAGNLDKKYPVEDSAELIVKTVMQSDEPVTLFMSGALTNLALALRLEPGIIHNIEAVYIMGGAVNVPGNLPGLTPDSDNMVAEWNIYADPLAASEVFTSGLNLYLVPLDATNYVKLTQKDTSVWHKGGSIPDFAADIYESLMASWNRKEVEIWDLVTAELMMNPQHCTFTPLSLEVVTEKGNTQGQTRATDGKVNINVCLDPDEEAIKDELAKIFSSRK